MSGKDIGDAIADVRNTEAGQEAIQWFVAAVFDVGDDFAGNFLADGAGDGLSVLLDFGIDAGDVGALEFVEIGEGFDEAALDELIDEHIAHAFDIHLSSAAKPAEALFDL